MRRKKADGAGVRRGRRVSRRRFVADSVLSAAIVPHIPVAALVGDPAAPASLASVQAEDWVLRARREIPATVESAYFQTGGIGPASEAALQEVTEQLDYQNRGPADPRFSTAMAQIEPELRAYLASTFNVGPNGVALTHSTSEGISIAAWSLNWQAGDEVVLSNQEHPANVFPWYVIRDRFGIVLREVDLDSGTSLLDEVRGVLGPRTRMVSISHVSRNNGRRLRTDESAELGALLRARRIRYHLDGAQGPGCVPVDFAALGCDCYSTCGHKWLLGPKGTGAFFVREDQLEAIRISWAGAHSNTAMDYEGRYSLLPSAARFEFGTRALADFAGFHRAVSWLEEVGFERVHQRIQELVGYAIERTHESGRFTVSSPEPEADRSGVYVLRLPEGCDSLEVYERLAGQENILTSPVRRERDLRLAIHFFNTRDEIDAAFTALDTIC